MEMDTAPNSTPTNLRPPRFFTELRAVIEDAAICRADPLPEAMRQYARCSQPDTSTFPYNQKDLLGSSAIVILHRT